MALQIYSPSPLTKTYYHHHHLHSHLKLSIKSQKPTTESDLTDPKPKTASQGLGFGSSTSTKSEANTATNTSKKKQKGKRERASIIRREPVEKPAFVSKEEGVKAEEQRKNESAFLLAWLGLGGIILGQGILLAASGFLPEQWDKFFVKYLYPSFTPTVGLFVAGTVAYGVLKYLQNESLKDQK